MNRTPRKRLVTLMAAAAGVTAALGSISAPDQAHANTPASTMVSDTVKTKAAPAAKKSGTTAAKAKSAPAKASADAKTAEAKKAAATPKKVVAPNPFAVIDENADGNGDGTGY